MLARAALVCLVSFRLATPVAASEFTIDAGALDGSGGYEFEDLDEDGGAELIGQDDSFLYAFSSYADSRAPTQIKKLVHGELKDVSQNPAYRRFLRQKVLLMEAKAPAQAWRNNGFLAGWVAAKALIGEGDEAWARMLRDYDRQSEGTLMSCDLPLPVDNCPEDKQKARRVDFPVALKDHSAAKGYLIAGVVGGQDRH
ncbi:MAG: hypothetical protein HYS06_05300 [Methylocystis sp.]|nr:hypothetical protein [Methylocystis sp.]MBI3275244.1 hypothetical protein [Methylocystis sp.]